MFDFLYGLPLLIIMTFWIFGTIVYLLPTIIALAMRKRQRLAIILLNIFGGWTGIGWFVALIWAAIKE
ncbi:MAG: superinfection immunity protein [Dehalococcoidales bacterium]|nr:superinfection immunity protein [Dehalococcoidales bacterium]